MCGDGSRIHTVEKLHLSKHTAFVQMACVIWVAGTQGASLYKPKESIQCRQCP